MPSHVKALLTFSAAILISASVFAGTPEETSKTFFDAYVKDRVSGLPTEAQMKTFGPLLSPEIVKLLAKAKTEKEEFEKKNPGEKPPWVEGALFSSLFEGVTKYHFGETVVSNGKASIPIYWEYTEDGETSRWIDVVTLEQSGGNWVITNIFFNAPWDFRPGPSLRAVLSSEP